MTKKRPRVNSLASLAQEKCVRPGGTRRLRMSDRCLTSHQQIQHTSVCRASLRRSSRTLRIDLYIKSTRPRSIDGCVCATCAHICHTQPTLQCGTDKNALEERGDRGPTRQNKQPRQRLSGRWTDVSRCLREWLQVLCGRRLVTTSQREDYVHVQTPTVLQVESRV